MSLKVILKIVMVIVNSAIFLAGAALVIIGALPEMKKTTVLEALYNSTVVQHIPADFAPLFNATYLLIAVGAVLAFMGFLGLWGAYYEDKCILMIFFIIIFIVFVAEVVAAILLLLYQPKVKELQNKLRTQVTESITEKYGKDDIITKVWNEAMSLMKCCGYTNYTDFNDSPQVKNTSLYPPSCCSNKNYTCDPGNVQSTEPVIGCFRALMELLKANSSLLGGVAVFVIAIEVVAMIGSLMLYKE